MSEFGERLRDIRQFCDLTQQQLAERGELSQVRVSAIERGSADPKLSELRALSRALGLPSIRWCFNDDFDVSREMELAASRIAAERATENLAAAQHLHQEATQRLSRAQEHFATAYNTKEAK